MVTDVWIWTPCFASHRSRHCHQSNLSESGAVYCPKTVPLGRIRSSSAPRALAAAARTHASLRRPSRVCGGSAGAGQRCVTPFRTRAEGGPAHPQPCIGPQHCGRRSDRPTRGVTRRPARSQSVGRLGGRRRLDRGRARDWQPAGAAQPGTLIDRMRQLEHSRVSRAGPAMVARTCGPAGPNRGRGPAWADNESPWAVLQENLA
jgi:hypothetical protein